MWGTPSLIDFVREYLCGEVNFDPPTAIWLFLPDELARTDLVTVIIETLNISRAHEI